jgi:hypothetical protein
MCSQRQTNEQTNNHIHTAGSIIEYLFHSFVESGIQKWTILHSTLLFCWQSGVHNGRKEQTTLFQQTTTQHRTKHNVHTSVTAMLARDITDARLGASSGTTSAGDSCSGVDMVQKSMKRKGF